MEFREQEEIKEAYRNLASAAGVNFNEKDVEVYLRKLIKTCIDTAFSEAGTKVGSLQSKISLVKGDTERAKEDIGDLQDRIISLKHDEIVNSLSEELSRSVREYEKRCDEITRQYSQQLNPFHQATEDFLSQMEAHKIPVELQVKPLCRFLETMSYAYWRAEGKKDDAPDWVKQNRRR